MRRHVRTGLVLLVILPLMGLLASCGSNEVEGGPEDTVRTFYRHLNDQSIDDAKRLYDDAARELLADSDDIGFQNWVQKETQNGTITKLAMGEAALENATATVAFAIVYDDGTRASRSVTLTQHDDQWRLGFISETD